MKGAADPNIRQTFMKTDHESFSFAQSAAAHGRTLKTEVLYAGMRDPLNDNEHPFYAVELEAQKSLGITPDSKLLVVERARVLDVPVSGEATKLNPSAFQRSYLNPARFPPDFLQKHFPPDSLQKPHDTGVSLMELYDRYGRELGYTVASRDTVLSARGVNLYEVNLIRQHYHADPRGRIVLDAEQRLYARDSSSGEMFVLEFLKASYLDDWKYEVKNRPA